MNEMLLVIEVVATFFCVVLTNRAFGKNGLFVWVAIASVTANVMTAKTIDVFGFNVTAGTVFFASVFLATDILCEIHGKNEAKKAVVIGVCSSLFFMLAAQMTVWFQPGAFDTAQEALRSIFALNLRISLSSVAMYAIANYADVYLFSKLKQITTEKYLWLRNNVATMICNCGENFLFILFAFLGLYSFGQCIQIALATSAVESFVALCDTPFLYMAKSQKTD